ncbi:hypothetical protein PGB28_14185 [Primorskyibacter aestuariivivens]|uniref:hypothetical protein n=1 Tax=Primorskyibacter aestuariivivens TaxID=1888912 RepID=UPI00230138ED|nr:hypothetical protein [Primorskyibacter aestuariivivens]MDA7429615.1 hypothetical protein [Primorskyibacter aestuariivivens]
MATSIGIYVPDLVMTRDGKSGAACANETNAMTKTEKKTGNYLPDIRLGILSGQESGKIAPCDQIAEAATALKNRDTRVAAAYVPPVAALARRLVAGASVFQALADWTAEIDALLALRRTHRGRMALFELPRTGNPSGKTLEAFSELTEGHDWPAELWSEDDVGFVAEPQFEPLAALALDSHLDHRELLDRLHAATSGDFTELPSRPELLDAELVALRTAEEEKRENGERLKESELEIQKIEAAARTRIDEANSRQDYLTAQVRELEHALLQSQTSLRDAETAAQVRFDKIETQRADLSEHVQELEERLSRAKANEREAAAATKSRLEEAEMQGKLLLRQVAGLQSALLKSEADRAAQKQEKLRLDAAWRRQVQDLSTMLAMFQDSTSWRATKPLRTVMRCFKR